jgi:hypothetical protein
MFPEHILTVRATVEAVHEEEFNRWYNQEHTPDVLRLLPGCLGGARYRVVDGDGSHQYMALYAFASKAALRSALQGDGIKELIRRAGQLPDGKAGAPPDSHPAASFVLTGSSDLGDSRRRFAEKVPALNASSPPVVE